MYRSLSLRESKSISPSFRPITLTSARKTFSSQRTSAAAGCPTRIQGEPNSVPEMIKSSEKDPFSEELKQGTSSTLRRRSVEARFTRCCRRLRSAAGLPIFLPPIITYEETGPRGSSDAIASSRSPSRVVLACDNKAAGRICVAGLSSVSKSGGYCARRSEQSYAPSSSSRWLTRI